MSEMNISKCSDNLRDLEFLKMTGMAVVVRRSPFSGETHQAVIKMTEKQYEAWTIDGLAIQHALPHLNAYEREFLMTGITPEDWKKMVGGKT